MFGVEEGTKLLQWLDPCCPRFCKDIVACPSGGLILDWSTPNTLQIHSTHINLPSLAQYANNAAALAGGLTAGDLYYTNVGGDGVIKIVI